MRFFQMGLRSYGTHLGEMKSASAYISLWGSWALALPANAWDAATAIVASFSHSSGQWAQILL